jgi:hypothetical protein
MALNCDISFYFLWVFLFHTKLHNFGFESLLFVVICLFCLHFSLSIVSTIMALLAPPSNFEWKLIFGSSTPLHVATFS